VDISGTTQSVIADEVLDLAKKRMKSKGVDDIKIDFAVSVVIIFLIIYSSIPTCSGVGGIW
jgi:hypothetical protein